jgi:hypothetical protein
MSSQRITASIRDALIRAAKDRRFAEEREVLVKKQANLEEVRKAHGDANYRELFKDSLELLKTIPDGWLQTTTAVRVNVEGTRVTEVNFHDPRPIPHNRGGWGVIFATIPQDSQILVRRKELDALEQEYQEARVDLVRRERELAVKVEAVISSVTTTGRLKEIWPEVTELLPASSQPAGAMLPAIRLDELNAELGLGKK